MTSEQLATQIETVINHLKSRIMGTGKEQYDMGDTQKIEKFTDAEVITNVVEELDDAIVYLAHLRSRLTSLDI